MWSWIAAVCVQVLEEHAIPSCKQRDILLQCVQARDGISLIWSHLGTQLPFAYVHLVIILVNLSNLVMVTSCGVVLAGDLRTGDYIHAASQVMFIVVIPLLYQGLLAVSYIISNPFGDDLLDFPVMAYQEYCNEAACAVSEYSFLCPATGMDIAPTSLSSHHAIALRRGLAIKEADAIHAGVSSLPAPLNFSRVPRMGNAGKEERMARQTLIEAALRDQLRLKDEVIQALQQQNRLLDSSLSATMERIQKIELRVTNRATSLVALPSNCASRISSFSSLPCAVSAQSKMLPAT